MSAKAVIFGLQGPQLTSRERDFFAEHQPLGFILFARNIKNPEQTRSLVEDLKSSVTHENVPILIDQEGGRVARLKEPFWRHPPPSAPFGELYKLNPERALQAVCLNHRLMAEDLRDLGITVDCAPMLDVRTPGAHDIVGDRSFSEDPHIVSLLGYEAIKGLADGGITAVIKHLPGHGLATCDSHEDLPFVDASWKTLEDHFAPFIANNQAPWAMTAHILFKAIDPQQVSTQSHSLIQKVIREHIGFDGFLISDDLGMKALKGTWAQKTELSLKAGCDAVLHCSGQMEEMEEVASATLPLSIESQRRLGRTTALSPAPHPSPFDREEALGLLDELLSRKAA